MHTIVVDDGASRGRSAESSTYMTPDAAGAVDRSIIAEALQRLSPAYRQILLETVIRRNTLPVTATRLGITAGTVRSGLHHAMHELRRELDIGRAAHPTAEQFTAAVRDSPSRYGGPLGCTAVCATG